GSQHVPEPGDRLTDVRHGEADMVGADEAQLTLADVAGQGATRIEERKRRRTRDDCRAFLQEVSAVTSKIAAHAFHPSLRRPGRAAGKSLSRRPTAVDT